MAGTTNRGKFLVLSNVFAAGAGPATFYVALVDASAAPSATTNTLSQLSEVPAGNGYTAGGTAVARSSVGFPTLTEDDTNNLLLLTMQDVAFTASGGNLPTSGNGARYAVLLDDNATVGNRQVIAYWDLGANFIASPTQALTLHLEAIRFKLPSGFTNRGLKLLLQYYFQGAAMPTNFYAALVDASSAAPGILTTVFSALTEIPAGNGYTSGGFALPRGATAWPTVTQDNVGNKADVTA